MLTRLQVSGFKNLVDVDIHLGPFTCIAGANGVGKSNLFDAIRFLSALADLPLIEAALLVRDEGGKTGDIRNIFHRVGNEYADRMTFTTEMIIPAAGVDDLGQQAKATITFLKYTVEIGYREDDRFQAQGNLELLKEELVHINKSDALAHLPFRPSPDWRNSVIEGRRNNRAPFISTDDSGEDRVINQHQDGGSSGRPLPRLANSLPRTVLSVSNAAETPTALLARREMQSWRLLQLEPSALRKPDEFTAPPRIGANGSHVPMTLYNLARENPTRIFTQVANRVSDLIDDVRQVRVDRDDKRELLTLQIAGKDGTFHSARALSDGTLRFLALAVLEIDPNAQGVLCLEEPENGIHPERIPAILELLQDIAMDITEPVDGDNPLRQVIINTHSPPVVQQVPADSLLLATLEEKIADHKRFNALQLEGMTGTWRTKSKGGIELGDMLAYLNPVPLTTDPDTTMQETNRVVDRPDVRQLVLPLEN